MRDRGGLALRAIADRASGQGAQSASPLVAPAAAGAVGTTPEQGAAVRTRVGSFASLPQLQFGALPGGAPAGLWTFFGDAAGRIPASFEILFLCGWAPHSSQPQPLPRGSATARLADALKPNG